MSWKQDKIVHCPIEECSGMLLQADTTYLEKCTDCKKFFLLKTIYTEVKDIVEEDILISEISSLLGGNSDE